MKKELIEIMKKANEHNLDPTPLPERKCIMLWTGSNFFCVMNLKQLDKVLDSIERSKHNQAEPSYSA